MASPERLESSCGCRLFGAYRSAISVQDAALLIHSTPGCNWGTLAFHLPSRANDIRQASSVLHEADIVFGGMDALEKGLGHALELYDAAAIFVLSGCVPEMMGDDLQAALRRCPATKPVILVQSAGFKGDMRSGMLDALRALIRVMPAPDAVRGSAVNIVGCFKDDFQSDADLHAIRRLLGPDIPVQAFIPHDTFSRLMAAPGAALNVVLAGFEEIGALLADRFGTPFVVVQHPYGLEGSRAFATTVAEALGQAPGPHLLRQEARAMSRLKQASGHIQKFYGMPVAFSGDGAREIALGLFLQRELGMEVEAAGRKPEDGRSVMLFGSSFDRGLAEQLGIPLIRVSYPVFDAIHISDQGYAGFEGAVNLVETIVNALMSTPYRRDR